MEKKLNAFFKTRRGEKIELIGVMNHVSISMDRKDGIILETDDSIKFLKFAVDNKLSDDEYAEIAEVLNILNVM